MAQNKYCQMDLTTLLGLAKGVASDYQSKPELNLTHTGDMIEALTSWLDYYKKVSDQ